MFKVIALAPGTMIAGAAAFAQPPQPYAGLERRPVKALSE